MRTLTKFNENEFIVVNIPDSNFDEQSRAITNQVNEYFEAKLKELEAEAVKGVPGAIMAYNIFVEREPQLKAYIEQFFLSEIRQSSLESERV